MRSSIPSKSYTKDIGHIFFCDQRIEFRAIHNSGFKRKSFLIDKKYYDLVCSLSNRIEQLVIDEWSLNSDSVHKNSKIDLVFYNVEYFEHLIEVRIDYDIPLSRVRDLKLNNIGIV